MDPEIWIPSKQRIAAQLAEDLKVALQSNPNKYLAFTLWVEHNTALLTYIGEQQTAWIIRDVASDLVLTHDNGDFVK